MYPIFRIILSSVSRATTLNTPSINNTVNWFHSLCQSQQSMLGKTFLLPTNASIVPSCGFKVKGILKRRCKDCYFVKRQDRLYIICETHPRHKQMQMVKKFKNTLILSHATQGKIRSW